jgi:hypothetical protein
LLQAEPDDMERLKEELIVTLELCNSCTSVLNKDEKMINARFIQQAALQS